MSLRHSLPTTFKTDAQCVAAVLVLHALFRKEFKRAAVVELFASSFRDEVTITIYAEPTEAEAAEVEWFTSKLNALYP